MDNYIGRLLDNRYEILEVIGTGGMAVVYKALDHRLNRMVAVKILKDEFSKNQEFRRRFHAESQAVAMLSNPNIVAVYDVSRTGDADYIVMELIEGITLKQYLEKKVSLNWRETLHFSMQIAKALEHAHGRGIVHRDIKPHNIMILKDGSIKVADFGIARVGSAQNTLTREALGSVHYISPEQAKGARVDNRSDLYSLGVVMYEMLTGRTPYDGETPVSVAIQHINGGAKRPSEIASGIPLGLEQITLHAMTSNVEDRYASAVEMLRDMEEFRKNPAITFIFGSKDPNVDAVTELAFLSGNLAGNGGMNHSQDGANAGSRSGMSRTDAERYAAARAGKSSAERAAEERRAERARREAELATAKRRNTMLIAIIAGAVVLVLLICLLVWVALGGGDKDKTDNNKNTTISQEDVEVDNFVGKKLEEIDPEDYPYLEVRVGEDEVEYDFSDEYEEGIVIKQSPKAGDTVRYGRPVKLTVSLGPELTEMPDLTEMSEEKAEEFLKEMKEKFSIGYTFEYEVNDSVEEGKVIRTDPAKGASLEEVKEIVVYVSLGEKKMPDLKGDTKEVAEQKLDELKLDLKYTYKEEESGDVEEGCVIRTEPAAGSDLEDGDEITIYISLGSNNTTVPTVIGESMENAIAMLKEAELDYVINEVYDPLVPEGYVVSQSEAPEDKVEKGTKVTIDISKGPEPEPSTEPSTAPSTEESTEPTQVDGQENP